MDVHPFTLAVVESNAFSQSTVVCLVHCDAMACRNRPCHARVAQHPQKSDAFREREGLKHL